MSLNLYLIGIFAYGFVPGLENTRHFGKGIAPKVGGDK